MSSLCSEQFSSGSSVCEISVDSINSLIQDSQAAKDISLLLISAFLVFFMQAGFTLVEIGSVRVHNVVSCLFKNFGDTMIVIIVFLFTFGMAFGESGNGFIGGSRFILKDEDYPSWFFQMAFASTSITVISGCILERVHYQSYFLIALTMIGFIYPVCAHWIWSATGWLSYKNPDAFLGGSLDFAGAGVVHVLGGMAGLISTWFIGPRTGLIESSTGKLHKMPGHSLVLQGLGTMILWFGWYGFNCGSTIGIAPVDTDFMGIVAANTTIFAAASALTSCLIYRRLYFKFDPHSIMNGLLCGLTSSTAGSHVIQPWAALLCGAISGVIFQASDMLLCRFKIDDPISAVSVHLAGGIWGLLSTGFFSSLDSHKGLFYGGGKLLASQILEILVIVLWVSFWSLILCISLHKAGHLRVSKAVETEGMDSNLGVVAYPEIANLMKGIKEVTAFEKLIDNSADPNLWCFRQYLVLEGSSHLLDFIIMCRHYKEFARKALVDMKLMAKSMSSVENLRSQIQRLFELIARQYIISGAMNSISFSIHSINPVQMHLDARTVPPISVFDSAEEEVTGILKTGAFRRYNQEISMLLGEHNLDIIQEEGANVEMASKSSVNLEHSTSTSRPQDALPSYGKQMESADSSRKMNVVEDNSTHPSFENYVRLANELNGTSQGDLAPKYLINEDGTIHWKDFDWMAGHLAQIKSDEDRHGIHFKSTGKTTAVSGGNIRTVRPRALSSDDDEDDSIYVVEFPASS